MVKDLRSRVGSSDGGSSGGEGWEFVDSVSGTFANSANPSISGNYTEYMLRVTGADCASATYLEFAVNGQGGAYGWREQNGQSRTAQTRIFVAHFGDPSPNTVIEFDNGPQGNNWGGRNHPRGPRGDLAAGFWDDGNVTTDITGLGLLTADGSDWSGTVELYGRDPQ